jgi:hypothetical protein
VVRLRRSEKVGACLEETFRQVSARVRRFGARAKS